MPRAVEVAMSPITRLRAAGFTRHVARESHHAAHTSRCCRAIRRALLLFTISPVCFEAIDVIAAIHTPSIQENKNRMAIVTPAMPLRYHDLRQPAYRRRCFAAATILASIERRPAPWRRAREKALVRAALTQARKDARLMRVVMLRAECYAAANMRAILAD